MSCEHCVQAVSSEVARLPGVRRVEIDLGAGEVTVSTDALLDRTQLAGAVEEAGYKLGPDQANDR